MQLESEKRLCRCCFTGHRPEKLLKSECRLKLELENNIRRTIADGMNVFISGMACGVDIWAAEIVLMLRREGQPIKLICAIPYEGFERCWMDKWQERYHTILKCADLVRFINPHYSPSCFRLRNEWMVDRSRRVIAVYNGTPGGTRNTINYAQACGVEVIFIDG